MKKFFKRDNHILKKKYSNTCLQEQWKYSKLDK